VSKGFDALLNVCSEIDRISRDIELFTNLIGVLT
jgi:hypothetical protein